MSWKIEKDGSLYYEGTWPFDEKDEREINKRITELEQFDNGFNRPQSICSALRTVIETHKISKKTVFLFSAWCDWSYIESMNKAREISLLLFGGTICPRLYAKGQRNRKRVPNADELYTEWVNNLVY
jgi:hypothetical protein